MQHPGSCVLSSLPRRSRYGFSSMLPLSESCVPCLYGTLLSIGETPHRTTPANGKAADAGHGQLFFSCEWGEITA